MIPTPTAAAEIAVPVTVRGLEILRRADGALTLGALTSDIGWEAARLDLFRMFHADLVHFAR